MMLQRPSGDICICVRSKTISSIVITCFKQIKKLILFLSIYLTIIAKHDNIYIFI